MHNKHRAKIRSDFPMAGNCKRVEGIAPMAGGDRHKFLLKFFPS
jgi:hypothetical protein